VVLNRASAAGSRPVEIAMFIDSLVQLDRRADPGDCGADDDNVEGVLARS
jgi:hypothetical protein